ncbi:MAG: PKD-like domain-containing protein [Bacteroidia bacterium]
MKRMLPFTFFVTNQPLRNRPWYAVFLFAGAMMAGIPFLSAQDCDPSGVTQAAVVCDGSLASFVISGLAPGETYEVDFDTNNGGPDGSFFSLTANGSGELTLQITMTAADNGSTFSIPRIEQITGSTCSNSAPLPGGIVSTTVQVNSTPSVTVSNDPGSPVCLNTEITHTASPVPASPGNGSYTYAWAGCNGSNGSGGCPGLTGFSGSGAVVTRTWANAGAKSVQVIVSTPGCPDVTAYANFTVSTTTALVSGDINAPAVCSGTALSLDPTTAVTSGTIADFDFNWSTASLLTNTASGTGTITGTVTNTGGAQADVVYSVTPVDNTGSSCSATPFSVTQPVDPVPVGSQSVKSDTICSGATSAATFTLTTGDAYAYTAVASGVFKTNLQLPARPAVLLMSAFFLLRATAPER